MQDKDCFFRITSRSCLDRAWHRIAFVYRQVQNFVCFFEYLILLNSYNCFLALFSSIILTSFGYLNVSDWSGQSTLFYGISFFFLLIFIPLRKNTILWMLVRNRILPLMAINCIGRRSFKSWGHTFWKTIFLLNLKSWRISVPNGIINRYHFISSNLSDFFIWIDFIFALKAFRTRILKFQAVTVIAFTLLFKGWFEIFLYVFTYSFDPINRTVHFVSVVIQVIPNRICGKLLSDWYGEEVVFKMASTCPLFSEFFDSEV